VHKAPTGARDDVAQVRREGFLESTLFVVALEARPPWFLLKTNLDQVLMAERRVDHQPATERQHRLPVLASFPENIGHERQYTATARKERRRQDTSATIGQTVWTASRACGRKVVKVQILSSAPPSVPTV